MRNVFRSPVLGCLMLLSASGSVGAQEATPSSLSETYSDWVVRCVSSSNDTGEQQQCEMAQELSQRDSGQRILVISIQPTDEGALVTFVAPFGLLLSDGIRMEVAGTPLLNAEIRTCLPVGCIGSVAVQMPSIAALAAGDTTDILMSGTGARAGSETRPISISVSLAGFTAAWNRVKTISQ